MAVAAGIVATLSVASKLLGFFRETSLAAVFGATHATDAYLVGQVIPSVIFGALSAGLSATFIPVFAEVCEARGKEAAYLTASTIINACAVVGLVIIALGEAAAPVLARIVAPGFSGEVLALTVSMSRLMFPMVLFQFLSALFTGMHHTEGDFATPALSALMLNACIIASTVSFGRRYGIAAVAVGTTLGAAAQALCQAPALYRRGFRWVPALDIGHPALRKMAKLAVPVLLGVVVSQVGVIVERMIASTLPEGSISALNYALRLVQLPYGVFGLTIATVLYPTMSRAAASGDLARFRGAMSQGIRFMGFVLLPMAASLIMLRTPLVKLAFERGAFDSKATEATAYAMAFYGVGVFGLSLRDLASKAFYSLHDTITPTVVGAGSVAINVALNLVLVRLLGHGGLALANSCAVTFGAVALLWYLRSKVGPARGKAVIHSAVRIGIAGAIMVASLAATKGLGRLAFPAVGGLIEAGRLALTCALGALVYGGASLLLKVPEAYAVLGAVKRLTSRRWAGCQDHTGCRAG